MVASPSLLLFLCLAVAGANGLWCCGDIDTKVTAQIKPVTRSRTIQMTAIETYNLKTGYKICPNNTVAEKDVPTGLGKNPDNTEENRKKIFGNKGRFNILGLLLNGKLDNDEYHSYCPVYSIKTRPVVKYGVEYYKTAVFDDEKASCPASKKICCRGYKQVGENCVEEKKAGDANDALDFLKGLGIVG